MANRNWSSGGKLYSMHTKPVLIDMSFQVNLANANGFGIKSLKGPCVSGVYMTTNQTKGAGSPGGTTGPAAGTIVVQLADNYNQVLGWSYSIIGPAGVDAKVDNSALTAGIAYTITILGNSTTAQWHSIGLPAGITPALGVSFIANAVGIAGEANTSTSRVAPSAAAGSEVLQMELVGDPSLMCAPSPSANQGFGAQLIFQARNDSSSDHSAIKAPAEGSIIQISLLLSDSSVTVQGS